MYAGGHAVLDKAPVLVAKLEPPGRQPFFKLDETMGPQSGPRDRSSLLADTPRAVVDLTRMVAFVYSDGALGPATGPGRRPAELKIYLP